MDAQEKTDVTLNNFYKKNENDAIFWLQTEKIGEHLFTFDKKEDF